VTIDVFRDGPGACILAVGGISDDTLDELARLEAEEPAHFRRLVARFERIANHGTRYHGKWWKTLKGTGGLRQLRYANHRFLLAPHPASEGKECFILLSWFVKDGDSTPPSEISRAQGLRASCLAILQREETQWR